MNAVLEIRTLKAARPDIKTEECCRLLKLTPGAAATYDYEAARDLAPVAGLFEPGVAEREAMVREILRALILHFRPPWGMLFPQGRRILQVNVPPDIRQCFDTAGFFNALPDPTSIAWWDELAELFRSVGVLGRIEVGRKGEMLSMDEERKRLTAAGHTDLEPRWLAIDNETAGYDISSFRGPVGNAKPAYIEVKASERIPFTFFLSENEWRVAQMFSDAYLFHFWYLPARRLQEVSVAEIEKHVPINQGQGTWKKVQIIWPFS